MTGRIREALLPLLAPPGGQLIAPPLSPDPALGCRRDPLSVPRSATVNRGIPESALAESTRGRLVCVMKEPAIHVIVGKKDKSRHSAFAPPVTKLSNDSRTTHSTSNPQKPLARRDFPLSPHFLPTSLSKSGTTRDRFELARSRHPLRPRRGLRALRFFDNSARSSDPW
jgi:hypothetical protein